MGAGASVFTPAIWRAIARRINSLVPARVAPAATQPGRYGLVFVPLEFARLVAEPLKAFSHEARHLAVAGMT